MNLLRNLSEKLIPSVYEAGLAIMEIYAEKPSGILKDDGSPVTKADRAAEEILISAIKKITPDITIISEENAKSHSLKVTEIFFLVDPLDGTKEFLKFDDKGSFTVNIGLIEKGFPVMGIVFAPALDRLFVGINGDGAYEKRNRGKEREIKIRNIPKNGPLAVVSSSHLDEKTDQWLIKNNVNKTVSIGSSLKFCLVASGEADVYPRFGPTSEWDTAAGDAILRSAGGNVHNPDGTNFLYGKKNYKNSSFIAKGNF